MTDADQAGAAVAAMMSRDRASGALGITVHSVEPGRASAELVMTELMVNGHGVVHGGYVYLLADTAMAAACNTSGITTVSAGADITYCAPAHAGDVLVAEAVERLRFGRSALVDVTVRRPDGAVIAEMRGRARELRPAGGGRA